MKAFLVGIAAAAAACGDNEIAQVTIAVPPAFVEHAIGIAALAPRAPITVVASESPGAPAGAREYRVDLVVDLDCAECYRIDGAGDRAWTVHAGDVLGAQYGIAHALENLGYRFRHPFDSHVPAVPSLDPAAAEQLGVLHQPQIRVRGFQFHTLHPIETYFALWEPGDAALAEAGIIFRWVVANRGNYVQWVGLDDIMDPVRHAAWQTHTTALVDMAHGMGLRTGLNIQLFGASNLQRAFDLSDDETGMVPLADELAARLPLITSPRFDAYDISFGEFFGAEPADFVAALDQTVAAFGGHAPGSEIHGLVHVGDDQRVSYMGEDLIYYFLVKFADPSIIPDVHTVMFYDLYEDGGGAYHHDDFAEHRAYIVERMAAGQPVVYLPETAYWVAFDVSVPIYLPLYVRNRWLDLDGLSREAGVLDGHILFSTGWEWGYWLNDYTALRASYELPADWRDLIADAFGTDLAPAVPVVADLVEAQREALLDGRLVAYLAGRDSVIDIGRELDVISQPDRITFDDLDGDPALQAAFAADQMPRLDAHADAMAAIESRAADLDIAGPWADELRDGIAVTAARARFASSVYRAALDHLAGDAAAARSHRDRAAGLLDRATSIVARRHAALHGSRPHQLVEYPSPNHTFYGYGYLAMADSLCYWRRELVQIDRLLDIADDQLPDCFF
jgi:hypothetical protein